MRQPSLDNCPCCETTLSSNKGKRLNDQLCPKCGYRQHSESRERLENLCQTLVHECSDWGVDTVVIKNHELTTFEALRADALLPILIDKVNQTIKGSKSIPFDIVDDQQALIKYRVIFKADVGDIDPDTYTQTLIALLDSLKYQTHDQSPGLSSNILDMNILLASMYKEDKKGTSINLIRENMHNKSKNKKIKEINKLKVIPIVKTMVDNRNEDAKFGQLKELKKTGARLLPSPNLVEFKETLNKEFPWFKKVTEILFRELSARAHGNGIFHLPPVILLGDPGIGKTAFCSRLAELCNVPFNFLGLGGTTSNLILAGTERGWNTARSSLALQTVMDHQVANPLILLDEIDKAGGSERNGHPHHTLLSLVEPSSAQYWYDPFLMGHTDLSHISWIATANTISHLPNTLLSRFRVINVESPAIDDYAAIVWRTRSKFCESYGLDTSWVPEFTDYEWDWLAKYFKSPRIAKRATEELLKYLITNPPVRVMN